MRKLISQVCILAVALNTGMFVYNLFADLHQLAVFNLLCASGCWVGYFNFKEGENSNGN